MKYNYFKEFLNVLKLLMFYFNMKPRLNVHDSHNNKTADHFQADAPQ